jgi:hypothetical protein
MLLPLLSTLVAPALRADQHDGVRVEVHRQWLTEGFAHVLGVVESARDEFVSVRLVVERLDPQGRRVGVRRWEGEAEYDGFYPALDVVPPRGRAVFHHVRDLSKLKSASIAEQRVLVDRVRVRPSEPLPTIADLRYEPEDRSERLVVRGRFTAPPAADCRRPTLVAAALDASGKLVGVSRHDPRDPYPFDIGQVESDSKPMRAGSSVEFAFALGADAPGTRAVRAEVAGECQNHALER